MLTLPKGTIEHYGQNVREMPKILESSEVPVSVAGIMQSRLKQGDQFPDLWNSWFDTSDLVVYPGANNNDMYVFLTTDNQGQITTNGRKALELIRPDNLASNYGAIVEQLEDLQGEGLIKIPRKNIQTGTYFTKKQVQNQQLWRVLARNPDEVAEQFASDQTLLKDYFTEVQNRTGDNKNMALYVGDSSNDKTILKAWYVGWLVPRSDANGRNSLVDVGRFLGIAPEAQGARGKSIENKVYTFGEILEESGNTNDFAPNQIKRLTNILEQKGYQIQKN